MVQQLGDVVSIPAQGGDRAIVIPRVQHGEIKQTAELEAPPDPAENLVSTMPFPKQSELQDGNDELP